VSPTPNSPRPIRLALVITELAVGGAERNLVRLATGLNREEFEPRVYSLKVPPTAPRDELVGMLKRGGVPVEFLNIRSAWQVPLATRRLAKEWKQWQPDLVHSFLFHANLVSTWAAGIAGSGKLIWGLRVADPNPRRQWLERRLNDRAVAAVCVSESVRAYAERRLGIEAGRLHVIPNGIEIEQYQNVEPLPLSKLGLRPHRRMLLCIGRLHEQKGFDWLLSFAPQLLQKLPEHDLVFVGDGPQRGRLKELALNAQIGERVHFAGFRADVPRCLAAADLVLVPSRWEGMPNVVLEAMASGRPVVATESEGVADTLGDKSDLQMTGLKNSVEFQQKAVAICSDQSLAHALGESNRKRVSEHFSAAAMIASHSKLYSTLATT
jgi:glycosyltransferase involved in cell wall biosynthesis